MPVICTAVNTEFTTTATAFRAQVTSGFAELQSRPDASAAWADICLLPVPGLAEQQVIIDNVPAATYRFVALQNSAPVVRAVD